MILPNTFPTAVALVFVGLCRNKRLMPDGHLCLNSGAGLSQRHGTIGPGYGTFGLSRAY